MINNFEEIFSKLTFCITVHDVKKSTLKKFTSCSSFSFPNLDANVRIQLINFVQFEDMPEFQKNQNDWVKFQIRKEINCSKNKLPGKIRKFLSCTLQENIGIRTSNKLANILYVEKL